MNDLIAPQAPPEKGKEKVIDFVIKDLQDKNVMGTKKYGTPLHSHNGRDALVDAYQEALVLVMYLRQAIIGRDNKP